ncbi:MAG: SgcJ/EcaC family oxidoreductase [Bacteroidota bacterium]|nr:SgcJ/EcaC family oxidoreductase [Bacteroidota bacterium]
MDTATERPAIEKLIFSFNDAFNAADIAATLASYTPDGILMPNNAPPAIGRDQIHTVYGFLFKSFEINIRYIIDDVTISGDLAFARSHSTVTTMVKASGTTLVLENKELFVLQKTDGQWLIAQYIFNSNHKN